MSTTPRRFPPRLAPLLLAVLVMEAIRKTVSSVIGVFDAMSATPCPEKDLSSSAAHHSYRETDGWPAVQDRLDAGLCRELIGPKPPTRRPDLRVRE